MQPICAQVRFAFVMARMTGSCP